MLRKDGTQESLVDRMLTRAELYALLDYDMNLPPGANQRDGVNR